jgi:hypothetical protein
MGGRKKSRFVRWGSAGRPIPARRRWEGGGAKGSAALWFYLAARQRMGGRRETEILASPCSFCSHVYLAQATKHHNTGSGNRRRCHRRPCAGGVRGRPLGVGRREKSTRKKVKYVKLLQRSLGKKKHEKREKLTLFISFTKIAACGLQIRCGPRLCGPHKDRCLFRGPR